MIRNTALFALLTTLASGAIACGGAKPTVDLNQPPAAAAEFQWGAPPAATSAILQRSGWEERAAPGTTAASGALRLVPASVSEESEASRVNAVDLPGSPAPLEVLLYGQGDQLSIVRIVRRGNKGEAMTFSGNALSAYTNGQPLWESVPADDSTTAGTFTTALKLFESDDIFVVLRRELFSAAEADLSESAGSVVELEIYAKKFNEGLTAEALTARLKEDAAN